MTAWTGSTLWHTHCVSMNIWWKKHHDDSNLGDLFNWYQKGSEHQSFNISVVMLYMFVSAVFHAQVHVDVYISTRDFNL